jgi:hypothetical protein
MEGDTMLVDDTYWWLRRRANEVAYQHSQSGREEQLVDKYAGHIAEQIEKLNAGNLLALINMAEA